MINRQIHSSRWPLVIGSLLVASMLLTACSDDGDGGSAVPVPDDAMVASETTMSGDEAGGLLLLDPGGELATEANVSVTRYEVAASSDAVVAFYDTPAEGWDAAFSTAFEEARILIWEREDERAWIAITPTSTNETSLIVIQGT